MIGLLMLAQVAAFESGNELYSICQTDPQGNCAAFVTAISDEMSALQAQGLLPRIYCLPTGATIGQIRDVSVKYLEEHPEARHKDAASLVSSALAIAFRCPSGK